MNSKLSNKPSRRDRPKSSTDKTSKTKRRGDQTPDKTMTPEPSVLGVSDDHPTTQHSAGTMLTKEDLETLAVNLDELKKQRPPKRPAVEKTRQLTVRKAIKIKDSTLPGTRSGKIVTYARPVDPDTAFDSYEKIGQNDPSLDDTRPYFEHHILGTLEEFNEQNQISQLAKKLPTSFSDKVRTPIPNAKIVKGRIFPSTIYQARMDQSNALENWEKQMIERRKQQGHLARFLNTSTELLGMNQTEDYRTTQEERHLIDRSIHSKDYGKGYRVGSEFWKQAELVGDEDSGVHMTLTQTERGFAPALEHVAKPETIKNEMGIDWSDSQSYRSMGVHRPWRKSSYLEARKEDLKEAIQELCPYKPYLQNLEVIGEPVKRARKTNITEDDKGREGMMETTSLIEETKHQQNDPLSSHPDILPPPIFGPSLTIAGRTASWTGSTHNRHGEIGIVCHVLLESNVMERVVSTLDIFNDGTAVIYYSWKSVPKQNKLGTTLSTGKQRFYFDKNSGVILPGDTLKFPFSFKSANPGMFDEEWELVTTPILNGGAAMRVVLKGLALQEDLNVGKREVLERELIERQTKHIIDGIVQEILHGVKTPDRPSSPIDAYVTDEELFARNNPEMCYNEEVMEELKQLSRDIEPEQEWDLRLSSLRELITSKQYEDLEERDGYLARLNHHVRSLAFHPHAPFKQEMYSTCYIMLCELVDEVVTQSDVIRNAMGLPLKEMIEGNTAVDESQDKKGKKTSEGTRLNIDKKDSKKEKRSGDRPVSSRTKTPSNDKKGSRGNSQNSSKAVENVDDAIVFSSTEEMSVEQILNTNAEKNYKEKLYFKAYSLVCETVEKIAGMFEEIQKSHS